MPRKPLGRRPRPRTAYHHGDLANALVKVSLRLVEERGLADFSLREAAADCGVAVSAAYKHFASKDALLAAVADLGFEVLGDIMEKGMRDAARGLSGTPAAEAMLVAIGRSYILFGLERPHLFRLMYGPYGPKGGAGDRRPDRPSRRISVLLVGALDNVLRAYGHDGGDDLGTHKLIAWSLVHGFAMMVVDGVWARPGKQALESMIAELGQAMLRSLR